MLDRSLDFHDFKYRWVFEIANLVRETITNGSHCVIDLASDIEKQVSKPHKNTILHDFIDYVISDYYAWVHFHYSIYDGYSLAEFEDAMETSEVVQLFNDYQINFLTLEEYLKQTKNDAFDYNTEYLRTVLEEQLTPTLVIEVFNLLFDDRLLMKEFNLSIANDMGERTKRYARWPKWLERALFCREKGRCAICTRDITPLLNTVNKPAIDHIVPIALNGVNDPTNLQMLCPGCNSNKSGHKIITSNLKPLYW
ncbi:HNH endonuclease [Legionella steelei]|uniref:HNH endonuclease n=1 Tax=Legionella steelei TaxID=947033 RepID=A0A0W0ZCN2_9GAMM|nr:HNH endonuclease signature motif containing protein [Legionella steelei]KTD66714.1 HNH endonuclease [Legionella steelei]